MERDLCRQRKGPGHLQTTSSRRVFAEGLEGGESADRVSGLVCSVRPVKTHPPVPGVAEQTCTQGGTGLRLRTCATRSGP